jgi:TonB family protein
MVRSNYWVGLGAALALSLNVATSGAAATLSLGPNLLPVPQAVAALSATPSCAVPSRPADVVEPYFEMPQIAQGQGTGGIAAVRIDLSSSGKLLASVIEVSSRNPNLDRAALQTAHLSRFAPETIDCQNVAGEYLLKVDFTK